jgi:integrase
MTRKTNFEGYDNISIEFLNKQNKSTSHVYKAYFRHFLKFTGKTGQQILDSKKADKNFETENKVMEFKQWMKTQKTPQGKPYSDNTIKTIIKTVMSFFQSNRTPLQLITSEKRKLNEKAKRTNQDYELTNETISKMALVGDLREKYILLLGKSFGLRVSDFTKLTYEKFKSIDLDQEPPIYIGETQTEKEGVNAYPFIDSDALPIVKAYLEYLNPKKDKPNNEKIITIQNEELSTILQILAKKANINLGGKRLRFHCLRKYLITNISIGTSESKWKQIIGKANPEEPYVNTTGLREIYLKAMERTTCINTNGNGKVSKLSEELTEAINKINRHETTIAILADTSKKKDSEIKEMKQTITEHADELKRLDKIYGTNIKEVMKTIAEGLRQDTIQKLNKIHPRDKAENEIAGNLIILESLLESIKIPEPETKK